MQFLRMAKRALWVAIIAFCFHVSPSDAEEFGTELNVALSRLIDPCQRLHDDVYLAGRSNDPASKDLIEKCMATISDKALAIWKLLEHTDGVPTEVKYKSRAQVQIWTNALPAIVYKPGPGGRGTTALTVYPKAIAETNLAGYGSTAKDTNWLSCAIGIRCIDGQPR